MGHGNVEVELLKKNIVTRKIATRGIDQQQKVEHEKINSYNSSTSTEENAMGMGKAGVKDAAVKNGMSVQIRGQRRLEKYLSSCWVVQHALRGVKGVRSGIFSRRLTGRIWSFPGRCIPTHHHLFNHLEGLPVVP